VWCWYQSRGGFKVDLRKVPEGLDLPLPQTFNLTQIKLLPCIKLDEADALEDLRKEMNSGISNLYAFLPLNEHDGNDNQLEGETENKHL
jgi:hypothetical protein